MVSVLFTLFFQDNVSLAVYHVILSVVMDNKAVVADAFKAEGAVVGHGKPLSTLSVQQIDPAVAKAGQARKIDSKTLVFF